MASHALAGPVRWLDRPVRITLANAGASSLNVYRVAAYGTAVGQAGHGSGSDLLANGNFAAGADRWTHTSDDHLAWHIKSLPLALLFEWGLIGTVAMVFLIVGALMNALRRVQAGDLVAAPWFAALAGFVAVGVLDTLVDAPRFLLLLLLLAGVAAAPREESAGSADSKH